VKTLVLNAGSSSLKYKLFIDGKDVAGGIVELVGGHKEYKEALYEVERKILQSGRLDSFSSLDGVGHRVVHGGELFTFPTLVDESVVDRLRELIPLAPLHNPANIEGIVSMRELAPKVPQVAVFDTAFHHTMQREAYLYAIPLDLYRRYAIRRYGFHGTSHFYVAKEAAKVLKKPLDELNLITLHLGNGASVCAVENGKSVDTSMGFTPLEGLVMGTRCGDLDPEIPTFLQEMGIDVRSLLNKDSGLKGLCGRSDMRDVERMAADGDEDARTALKLYARRVCKYIGAYSILLGRIDALVFTAGVGENSPVVRDMICQGLRGMGIVLDRNRNGSGERIVSADDSEVEVLVVQTNEELEIARQTEALLSDNRL